MKYADCRFFPGLGKWALTRHALWPHCSKSAHFWKNISVTFSMTTKGTCWVLAKTGAERSVDDFVSLRTAMKYYDNLAKRKRRLKKKVKVPLVVIFLLIFIPAPERCGPCSTKSFCSSWSLCTRSSTSCSWSLSAYLDGWDVGLYIWIFGASPVDIFVLLFPVIKLSRVYLCLRWPW